MFGCATVMLDAFRVMQVVPVNDSVASDCNDALDGGGWRIPAGATVVPFIVGLPVQLCTQPGE